MASKAEKMDLNKSKPAEASKKESEQPDPKAAKKDSDEAQKQQTGESKNNADNKDEKDQTSGDSKPAAAGDGERGRRVYVGNLAWECSWQDLKDHMRSTGLDAVRANIMCTVDGRSKGCGIVEFATPDQAQQAVLTLNDTELKGRQIFVREDREDRSNNAAGGANGSAAASSNASFVHPIAGAGTGGASAAGSGGGGGARQFSSDGQSRRVYVGNLSWDVAWQDLKDHMRKAGEVLHAEVITEHNGRSKGCGIVEFATEDAAVSAIQTLTDTELKGRMIFVREDRETSSAAGGGSVGHHSGGGGGGHHTGYHAPHHHGGGRGGAGGGNTSVYVWNLTPETSWQDLKDHMRKAGNVDSATVLTNAQGESLCCGVVVYQRPQEAARAIRELQNSELNSQPIFVREDRVQSGRGGGRGGYGGGRGGRGGRGHQGGGYGGRGRGDGERGGGPPPEEGTQLYVGNLAYETSWRELKDHFRQCGDVRRAEVVSGPGGQSKGFGTVAFFSKKDADAAISRLNGSELQGRTLEVRLDSKAR